MKFSFLLCFVAALSLIGCSGGGLTGSGTSLSIASSATTIDYGDTVTISWSSSGIDHLDSQGSSFQVVESQVDGSITDRPAVTTVYTLRGVDAQGNGIVRSKTVSVRKSNKKILLVGDTAQAGVPQLAQTLRAISTQGIDVSGALPSLTNYDVVLVHPSASISPSDQNAVTSFLSAGNGVVLLGDATRKLANGGTGTGDVSAIGSWLAGCTELVDFLQAESVVATSPAIPIGAVLLGDSMGGALSLQPVSSNAVLLSSGSSGSFAAFVYSPTIGGRVGFVGALGEGSTGTDATIRGLILTECRWAADGAGP